MSSTFAEHARESQLRMKQSGHRFFEHPAPVTNDFRQKQLYRTMAGQVEGVRADRARRWYQQSHKTVQ